MSNHLGLYYPFIHFRNESWLKLTSLYWDRMARIVPRDYGLHDTDTVREFKDGGYVLDWRPGEALAKPARAFRALLATHGDRLRERFGLHLSASWPDDPSTAQSRAAHFGNVKLAYVYGPKVVPELIADLESFDLAERGGVRDPRWIGMHPRLAAVYMTALADAMAASRKAQPISDDALAHVGIGDISLSGLAEALLDDNGEAAAQVNRETKRMMADLAIALVVPARLDHLSAATLNDFRMRYAAERSAFQAQIAAMITDLDAKGISDTDALLEHLQIQYEKHLRPQLVDLKRRLKGARIDTTTAVVNIKTEVPAGLATAAGLMLVHAPRPVIAADAVALTVWGIWQGQRRTRRTLLDERPAISYLYQMETNLSPNDYASRIERLRRRFTPRRAAEAKGA